MQKTIDDVKYYLKSKTAKGLQVLMVKNNIDTQAYHDYRIMFADGFWYAWYEGSADELLKNEVARIDNVNKH